MVIDTQNHSHSSFVRRALERMTQSNSVQGRRYVNGYLLSLDDTTLNARGYDRKELGPNSPSVIVY